MSAYRKGFVLLMWTGFIENERTGRPVLFSTVKSARRALARLPAWGRPAVAIYRVRVRPNQNGRPDYIVGRLVQAPASPDAYGYP